MTEPTDKSSGEPAEAETPTPPPDKDTESQPAALPEKTLQDQLRSGRLSKALRKLHRSRASSQAAEEVASEPTEDHIDKDFEKEWAEPKPGIKYTEGKITPLTVTGSWGAHEDGQEYLKTAAGSGGVPADEVIYNGQAATIETGSGERESDWQVSEILWPHSEKVKVSRQNAAGETETQEVAIQDLLKWRQPKAPVERAPSPEEPGTEEIINSSPRSGVMDTAQGQVLITVDPLKSPGEHSGRSYVWVNELGRAVPEDEIIYGTFRVETAEAAAEADAPEPEADEGTRRTPEGRPDPEHEVITPETTTDEPAGHREAITPLTAEDIALPRDIAEHAIARRFKVNALINAKLAWPTLDWSDIMANLEGARGNEKLAKHMLTFHHIDVTPVPRDPRRPLTEAEWEEAKRMSLPEIAKKEKPKRRVDGSVESPPELPPGTWELERERREERDKGYVADLLRKHARWIPKDMSLPRHYRTPVDLKIPEPNSPLDTPFNAYGVWRRLLINSCADQIEHRPGRVKFELKRIGRLGAKIPLINTLAIRYRASKLLRQEQARAAASGIRPEHGVFNMGHSRWLEYVQAVENYDDKVKEIKRAFGWSILGVKSENRRTIMAYGGDTYRRIMAEEVVQLREKRDAFLKGQLNPEIPDTEELGAPVGTEELVS